MVIFSRERAVEPYLSLQLWDLIKFLVHNDNLKNCQVPGIFLGTLHV